MDTNVRPASLERITTEGAAKAFVEEQVEAVRRQVGDKKVLLALSGGVDSSVVAALLIRAVGKQLVCVHVNHGLLRKGEPEQVVEVFRGPDGRQPHLRGRRADRFLHQARRRVSDPETKRRRSSARSSSRSLRSRRRSSRTWNSWRRAPSIPIFWRARRA